MTLSIVYCHIHIVPYTNTLYPTFRGLTFLHNCAHSSSLKYLIFRPISGVSHSYTTVHKARPGSTLHSGISLLYKARAWSTLHSGVSHSYTTVHKPQAWSTLHSGVSLSYTTIHKAWPVQYPTFRGLTLWYKARPVQYPTFRGITLLYKARAWSTLHSGVSHFYTTVHKARVLSTLLSV